MKKRKLIAHVHELDDNFVLITYQIEDHYQHTIRKAVRPDYELYSELEGAFKRDSNIRQQLNAAIDEDKEPEALPVPASTTLDGGF